jgi:hypothetical protein
MTPGYGRAPPERSSHLTNVRVTFGKPAPVRVQILRDEGELPPEIDAIERRAGGRGEVGRFKIRFERIASAVHN